MGLFDKVAKTASNVGAGVASSAAKAGASAVVAGQEQTELLQLKSQISVINQELDALYAQVGKKYIDFVLESGEMPGIDVSDLLKLVDPKLSKKQEIEQKIIELEKEIKDKDVLREKQRVEQEFTAEKEKLDKALAMDVISKDDYEVKIAIARKKVDNFEEIRRVEKQAEMGLITAEEKIAKLKELTE